MLVDVAETHPAPPGKKVAAVVTTDGARLGCWPEQLAGIKVGGRYEVEVKDGEFNGRVYRTSPRRLGLMAPLRSRPPRRKQDQRSINTETAARQRIDRFFVQGMLQAALQSGELTFDKTVLYHATVMLTQLYRHTLGNANEGVFLAGEAGHRNHGSEQP